MTSPSTFHGPTLTEHNTTLSDEMRFAAIAARDRSQDGEWYYAVRTTGVFCKPSCGARLAKRGGRMTTKVGLQPWLGSGIGAHDEQH